MGNNVGWEQPDSSIKERDAPDIKLKGDGKCVVSDDATDPDTDPADEPTQKIKSLGNAAAEPLHPSGSSVYWNTTDDITHLLLQSEGERKAKPLHPSGSSVYWNTTADITQLFFPPDGECAVCEDAPPPRAVTDCPQDQDQKVPNSTFKKRKADELEGNSESTECGTSGLGEQISRNVKPRLETRPTVFCGTSENSPSTKQPCASEAPVIIAHSHGLQTCIDRLSVGVQWEIARLISRNRLSFDDVDFYKINTLLGSNVQKGPEAARVLLDEWPEDEPLQFADAVKTEREARSPWNELDSEVYAFQRSQMAALGGSDSEHWYGGKVQFAGKLKGKNLQGNPGLHIELERLVLGPSTKFTRRWGSSTLIRVHVSHKEVSSEAFKGKPRTYVEEALTTFFSRPFILLGRVYRAFFAKEHTVLLVLTNERVRLAGEEYETYQPSSGCSSNAGLSVEELYDWFNPLALNTGQTMVKWSARFALAFSNSVPGIILKQENVKKIDDIISPAWDGKGKIPSEMIMTDGCGFANAPLLSRLQEKYEWDNFPTVVQVRIAGAKGLLLLDPNGRYSNSDSEEPPTIYIRPSQVKIKYSETEPMDPAMLVLDVLRHAKLTTPGRIGAETIVNLSENGVPKESFIKLMDDSMRELAEGLCVFDGQYAMQNLFHNVMRSGSVIAQRLSREYGGEARVRGAKYVEREQPPEDDGDDEDELRVDLALHERSSAWWADQVSGQPSTLEETVMGLLASGFHPRTCPVLAEKLRHVLQRALNGFVLHYRITVPMSATAFVVPDPLGVLEEGEIFMRISNPNSFMGQDKHPIDIITGDVIVTRHPCKVPTDSQKVRAVEHGRLRQYTDVIIFSTKGRRSLASMLGGGDYDGDKVTVIWQPEIVECFRNADPSFADPPEGIEDKFIKNTETVDEFLERITLHDAGTKTRTQEIQKYVLGALRDCTVVGRYSKMHDYAVYMLGYAHEESKRLAYMFSTCLDGAKTGLRIDPKVLEADIKKYGRRSPAWTETPEEAQKADSLSNEINPKRPETLHGFIMDTLRRNANRAMKFYMSEFEKKVNNVTNASNNSSSIAAVIAPQKQLCDTHLVDKYERAMEKAERLQEMGQPGKMEDLEKIKRHVESVRVTHRAQLGKHPSAGKKANSKKPAKGAGFTELSIETRQDVLRAISRRFASGPKGLLYFEEEELSRVRASYAYVHDLDMMKRSAHQTNWTRYPWDVAFRDLCAIKAEAVGFPRTITGEFYEKMVIANFARKPK